MLGVQQEGQGWDLNSSSSLQKKAHVFLLSSVPPLTLTLKSEGLLLRWAVCVLGVTPFSPRLHFARGC